MVSGARVVIDGRRDMNSGIKLYTDEAEEWKRGGEFTRI